MTHSFAPFCWLCRRNLGSHNHRIPLSWAVVVDKLGHEHRVHKACVRHVVADGESTLNRFETVAER